MAKSGSSGVGIFIGLLITSIFSGLILSIWALIAKKSGNGYLLQLIFGLICIVFFGWFLSYHLYMGGTGSGKDNEIFMYYVGLIGTYSNALAAFIWLISLFTKSNK